MKSVNVCKSMGNEETNERNVQVSVSCRSPLSGSDDQRRVALDYSAIVSVFWKTQQRTSWNLSGDWRDLVNANSRTVQDVHVYLCRTLRRWTPSSRASGSWSVLSASARWRAEQKRSLFHWWFYKRCKTYNEQKPFSESVLPSISRCLCLMFQSNVSLNALLRTLLSGNDVTVILIGSWSIRLPYMDIRLPT